MSEIDDTAPEERPTAGLGDGAAERALARLAGLPELAGPGLRPLESQKSLLP